MLVDFDVRGQQGFTFFAGWSIIMEYVCIMDSYFGLDTSV